MSRMKAKKRRIMTKINRKKRLRQSAKMKQFDVTNLDGRRYPLEHPSAYKRHNHDADVSNY